MEKGICRQQVKKDQAILASVITSYDHEREALEQTYLCILNQTFPWFEWIITIDGSAGSEKDFLYEFSERDFRIKVYSGERGEISGAENGAVDKAKSDLVIFLDIGNLIEPTYLEITYWALRFRFLDQTVERKMMWNATDMAGRPKQESFNVYQKPRLSEFRETVCEQDNKIRIMMLLPWMKMGGADAFNLEIVKRLDKQRYNISILTTVEGKSDWREQFSQYTNEIFELPSFLNMENYAEFISYIIYSRQIDIAFISNSYYGYSIIPWLRANFSNMAIVDYVHAEERYWRNGGYARISAQMGEFLEKTYVCNERTRNAMTDVYHRKLENVKTLYVGVDHERYCADAVEAGIAKSMLHIDRKRPCVLFPCRICQEKRPWLMVEIAEKLKGMNLTVAVMVVGDGPMLKEIQDGVKEKGLEETVYFAGRQEDMRPFYKDADLTLICSIGEGLALTAYESCSMGVPVISSDVGGQGELIDNNMGVLLPLLQKENEIGNYTYSEKEVMQYADNICQLLKDKERYAFLSQNCRKRIEEKFSLDVMIEILEREIQLLCRDGQYADKRRKKNGELRNYYNFTEEFLSVYNECELRDREIVYALENVKRLQKELECKQGELYALKQAFNDMQNELNTILNMRSWKLCQHYLHFMNTSLIGKIIGKFRHRRVE